MPVVLAAVAVLGLALGSFLNVVAYRLPRHESLVHPGSHCPNCGHAVRAWHNVPVLAWLMLRGACADCNEPISVRYPIVELATGAVFVAVATRLLGVGFAPALLVYFLFAGIALAAIGARLMLRATPVTSTAGLEK
jgi:leader peptidase (prepilin peptidase)/N-methyltransferase